MQRLPVYLLTLAPSLELSGVAIGPAMMEASARLVGEGIDSTAGEIQGVDITVWSDNGDFSAMGYVVDQLDSLIDEWFPGLVDISVIVMYSVYTTNITVCVLYIHVYLHVYIHVNIHVVSACVCNACLFCRVE